MVVPRPGPHGRRTIMLPMAQSERLGEALGTGVRPGALQVHEQVAVVVPHSLELVVLSHRLVGQRVGPGLYSPMRISSSTSV